MRWKILAAGLAGLVWLAACDNSQYEEPQNVHYRVDRTRDRVWQLSLRGVSVRERASGRETWIDLPGWIVAGAADGCLPALALGPKGEAVVTSNVIPTLWRVDPVTLAVTVHAVELNVDRDKDVGFSELAFSPTFGSYFAVSQMHGSVWKIDSSLRRAERVTPPAQSAGQPERRVACAIN